MNKKIKSEFEMLIEITNDLRDVHRFLVDQEKTRLITQDILDSDGKVSNSNESLLGRFIDADELENFLTLYAIAYNGSFDSGILTLNHTPPDIPLDKGEEIGAEALSPLDLSRDINRVRKMFGNQAVITLEDTIGFYTNVDFERIRCVFEEIGDKEEDFLVVSNCSMLVNVAKVDRDALREKILTIIMNTKSRTSIGDKSLIHPNEQKEIVGAYLETDVSEEEALLILRGSFSLDKQVAWEDSVMKYELGHKDRYYLNREGY